MSFRVVTLAKYTKNDNDNKSQLGELRFGHVTQVQGGSGKLGVGGNSSDSGFE